MAKFATASDALTAALAIVNGRLTNIDIDEELELYLELIDRRAKIQQAIGASGGGGGVGGGDVSVISSALPTGAATSANQSTANSTLSSLNGKLILPASLGQKTAANSLAVTLATDGVASGIATQIGEVQASPTANTVLARLKSIADALVSGIKTTANSFSTGNAQDQFTETQLTAPSSTTARSMVGYTNAFIQVVIASINTNVVLRIEGSNDGTNWANLSVSNSDTVITSNGTQGFIFSGCPQFIRTTFVSESGGTTATVDVITRLSA